MLPPRSEGVWGTKCKASDMTTIPVVCRAEQVIWDKGTSHISFMEVKWTSAHLTTGLHRGW